MGKLITYGNVLIYVWVSVAMSRGFIEVFGGEFWRSDMSALRLPFLILLGGAVALTVACCAGLLLRKGWALKLSIPWNISLGLLVGAVPIASIMIATDLETVKETFNAERALGVGVGVLLLLLAGGLRGRPVQKYFGGTHENAI